MSGHSSDVLAVAVFPDGMRVVSGSIDGTGNIWNVETGSCLCTMSGHRKRMTAVAVFADGESELCLGVGTKL